MRSRLEIDGRVPAAATMTWYAHQVFFEPSEAARKAALALPGAAGHLYHLPPLRTPPQRVQDGLIVERHAMTPPERELPSRLLVPPGGLLVLRELCASGSSAAEWFGVRALPWEPMACPARLVDDPLLDLQRVFEGAPDWWQGEAPPAAVLGRLRAVAVEASSRVAYFCCQTWGGDIECCFAWSWAGGTGNGKFWRAVVTPDAQGKEATRFYTDVIGVLLHQAAESRVIANADVLSLVMLEFGLQLAGGYFAPHTGAFPWHHYRVVE